MKRSLIILLLAVVCAAQTGNREGNGAGAPERIAFDVRVLADGPTPDLLTEAVIDGPEGTDFNIDLNTRGFEMKAEFLTDRVEGSETLMRVRLETRRSYGLSPNGLPLYEEDRQEHSIRVSFNESLVLLPFGRNSSGDTLKIEILNAHVTGSGSAAGNLKINFRKRNLHLNKLLN